MSCTVDVSDNVVWIPRYVAIVKGSTTHATKPEKGKKINSHDFKGKKTPRDVHVPVRDDHIVRYCIFIVVFVVVFLIRFLELSNS